MSKNAKKITALEQRIVQIETEMKESLAKKKSKSVAYDVPGAMRKIADLRKDISYLK